jgi:hypothetical protein
LGAPRDLSRCWSGKCDANHRTTEMTISWGNDLFSHHWQWSLDQLRPLGTQAEIDADIPDDQK